MVYDKKRFFTLGFLLAELVLYILILTTGGDLLVWSSFGAIVLCFLFALLRGGEGLLVAGLGCTVAADFFLVVCSPMQQLYGMICFLAVQTLYAVFLLHRILFVDFNLSWFFYLPSQVLIALTAANRKQKRVPRFS